MEGILMFVFIVVCVLLILVVLLQSGKSADLAGAFGGVGSQSTFGPRGSASFMSKLTTILAILFMVLTLALMIVSSRRSVTRSVLGPDAVKQEQAASEKPAAVEEKKAETSNPAAVKENTDQKKKEK